MSSTEKRVLVLGAGFVSGPVVEYLTRNEQVHITAVSANPRTTPLLLDIKRSQSELDKLIKEHDCVVSLLPYGLHPDVAALCIKHRRHMVTTSYVSPKMKALHDEYGKYKLQFDLKAFFILFRALAADVTLLNEVGLDPGIDHMLAMELFEIIRDDGGRIDSYISYCGGLPAPEHADNPLRYKFRLIKIRYFLLHKISLFFL
jgi:alpha-aminoadipic semialdehyde synthase